VAEHIDKRKGRGERIKRAAEHKIERVRIWN
jgi:hypothetical protein